MSDQQYYRYEDGYVWSDGDSTPPKLWGYPIIHETPATVVIRINFDDTKRVFKGARKSFAHATPSEALASYIIRKQRHIQHAAMAHDKATWNLAAAQAMQAGEVVKDLERWRNPLIGVLKNGGPTIAV